MIVVDNNMLQAISTVLLAASVIYAALQVRENSYQRELAVMKEAYDYIRETRKYRRMIYQNKEIILKTKTVEELKKLEKEYPDLYDAIQEVFNCYHYVGFLIKLGFITKKKKEFIDEIHEPVLRINEIAGHIIDLENKKAGYKGYKKYFRYLIQEIKQELDVRTD